MNKPINCFPGMSKKRGILMIGGALALGGSLLNCAPADAECRRLTEPSDYEVHACDVFPGPFGIDAVVKDVDESGNVDVSYFDSNGRKLFDDFFSPSAAPVAHYGINVYHAGEEGTLVRTNNVMDLYAKCVEIMNSHSTDPSLCSKVAPTEALPGEILEKASIGYFGKTNNAEFPQLAVCAAKGLERMVIHTSLFLDLPPLEPGVSSLDIFMKNPSSTGVSYGSMEIWYQDTEDWENIKYNVEYCNTSIEEENFSKGDHELTHLFTRGFDLPFTFNEGLADFVSGMLNDKSSYWSTKELEWNTKDSLCKENGFQAGYEIKPYIKYEHDPKTHASYASGECFWVKLIYDYDEKIIPSIMDVLAQHRWENNFPFKTALTIAGVDFRMYRQWGF